MGDDDPIVYADPNQPHPWANKTADEIVAEMVKLMDGFKVRIPDPTVTLGPITDEDRRLRRIEFTVTLPPWFFLDLPKDQEWDVRAEVPRCDCGALKAKTTHADWCSTKGGPRT